MGPVEECSLCGRESPGCEPRLMFHHWWAVLLGRQPVERELVCPRCRGRERRKTALGLGLLLALAAAATAGTIMVVL